MWALPLSSCRRGAGNGVRTRDIQLGRLTLYQLSYSRGFRFPEWWWREKDSNLRRRVPADLQSAPFGRSGIPPHWNHSSKLPTPVFPRLLFRSGGYAASTMGELAPPWTPQQRRDRGGAHW